MTKRNGTKRALLSSVVALFLCFSMLLGTTFAWFTDTVTSAGNIIQSGTLDVTMEWKDATATGAQQTYIDASVGAIFNYDKWEPGYVEAKNIKIGNAGNLALKYQLNILATGAVSELANVIDVYYAEGEYTLANRDMTELTRLGTLTEVLAQISTTASGDLLEGESDTVTLALKMQESAGNEYQGLAIGSDFAVQLLATQLTYEKDSFDDQYDVNAPKTEVATAAELQKVLNEGGYAVLTADITAEGNKRFDVPVGTYAVLDLNGHTLTSKDGGGSNTMAIYIDKGAVLTLNDSVGGGKIVSSCYGVYVKQNAKFIMNGGTLNVSGNGAYDIGVTVWNADFVMNGGTINSKFGVWASNYYRDTANEAGLNTCYVKIADGCVLNSTGYADVEFADALDAVIDVPSGLTLYPAAVSNEAELQAALASGEDYIVLAANIETNIELVLAEGTILDGKGFAITYDGEGYEKVRIANGAVIKNLTLNNYRGKAPATADSTFTLEDVTINFTYGNCTGLDISGSGSGKAILKNVVVNGTTDPVHLDPATQIQEGYSPYGDVLLGGTWALEATDCQFGSLHGWNTTNGSNVSLTNTTYAVFRMHYWNNRTLYINGVQTAWSDSDAVPVVHDVYGCWKVMDAFK